MPTNRMYLRVYGLSILMAVAVILAAGGCDARSEAKEPGKAEGYTSQMAISITLTNPATGSAIHGTVDELRPVVLREAERITQPPVLRQMLNQPTVQQTTWFERFGNDLDQAYLALRDEVLTVEPVAGTGLIRVHATTEKRDDAQIILTALRDEYISRINLSNQAETDRRLRAAQRRMNAAEDRVVSIHGSIKRFLVNTPLDTTDESTSEAAWRVKSLVAEIAKLEQGLLEPGLNPEQAENAKRAQAIRARLDEASTSLAEWTARRQEQTRLLYEYQALQRELMAAEAERERTKTQIMDLVTMDRIEGSSLGYRVYEEYPPQIAEKN